MLLLFYTHRVHVDTIVGIYIEITGSKYITRRPVIRSVYCFFLQNYHGPVGEFDVCDNG